MTWNLEHPHIITWKGIFRIWNERMRKHTQCLWLWGIREVPRPGGSVGLGVVPRTKGLRVWSLAGVRRGGNWSMVLSLSPCPSSLFLKSVNISLSEDLEEKLGKYSSIHWMRCWGLESYSYLFFHFMEKSLLIESNQNICETDFSYSFHS